MSNVEISDDKKAIEIISATCVAKKSDSLEAILKLESAMLEHDQVDIPVNHIFHGGMYARELTIKKGTLLTGRIHKFDHFDIMLSGDITVSTDSGEVKRLTGLNIMKGLAGKKRAGYAHEDTHWITFHASEERDGAEMYEFLTCGTFEELDHFNIMVSRSDYQMLVADTGISESEIFKQVVNSNDQIRMPEGYEFLYTSESEIHGQGFFSKNKHLAGKVICPARIDEFRTTAGRYVNHAFNPNSAMIVTCEGVNLVALKDIDSNTEITVNYRDVISHRSAKGDLCQQ